MYKRLLPLVLLFSSSMFGQVVRDTVWQDVYKYPTTKESATTFTVYSTAKNQKLSDIQVFNKETNTLVQKGKGIRGTYNAPVYEGEVVEFDKLGKKTATSFYADEMITKMISHHPITKEEFVMYFEEGVPHNGKIIQSLNNSFVFVNSEDGKYVDYYIFNPENPKNRIVYYLDENNTFAGEEYFDATGKSIYKSNYSGNLPLDGQSVTINYHTFTISNVSDYVNGDVTKITDYFVSGKVRATGIVKGNTTTTTYFDANGKQLASNTTTTSNDYDVTYEGDVYTYNDNTAYPDLISTIYTYKKGIVTKYATYTIEKDKNYLDNIAYYKDSYPTKIEYYNADGTNKSTLTYKENSYDPLDGILEEYNTTTVYKNGIVLDIKQTYENGKLFKHASATQATFYDKSGKVIGKTTYKTDSYGYSSPYEGTSFELFEDNLYSQSRYKQGVLEYEANYSYTNFNGKITDEVFYKDGNKVKAVSYYPNGKKKKEEVYSSNAYVYEPINTTYYDATGKVIGMYDAIKNDGTKYEFYDDENIQSIKKYKNGELTYAKVYELIPNQEIYSATPVKYYLQSEIDYAKQGKFYDTNGSLLSTATYKNGVPYNGKVYLTDEYQKTEVNFINGAKDGVETLYSIYDQEVTQKTYYEKGTRVKEEYFSNGLILKTCPYVDDQINGDVIFYDTEGDLLSTLTYVDGEPMDGESITADYYRTTKEVYVDGIVVTTNYYNYEDYTPIMDQIRIGENAFERTVYNDAGEVNYQYELNEGKLNGSYKYFVNGKVKYQAELHEGKLISGSIVITDLKHDAYSYGYSTPTSYSIVTASKKETKVQKLDIETNKVVFELSAKVKKGNTDDNPILNTEIDSSSLYPTNELNTNYAY